jgi:hypothetical protein
VKEIREWLEKGQDYAQGVALYEKHGKSRVVLSALRCGITAFTRQKLKSELEKLAIATPASVRVVDTSAKHVHETPKRVQVLPKVVSSPEKVASSPELQAQRRAWFAERNHLHPQLELVATTAERLAMSLRILELGDLISASYASAPEVAVPEVATARLAEVIDAGEIRRLLANLRPQRTKLKKRPDRAADLAQVEADIKQLEEKLKRDGGEPKL